MEALRQQVARETARGVDNSFDMQLLRRIDREVTWLKSDPHRGWLIPKRNITKTAEARYGTRQIWKLNLTGYWRMLYMLTDNDIDIIAVILEFMDHKRYDKVFGYRKR